MHLFKAVLPLFAASMFLTSTAQAQKVERYHPDLVSQYRAPLSSDIVPSDDEARRIWARNLAFQAFVYGATPELLYEQMYNQALDTDSSRYTGFNKFAHGRALAGPGYKQFKTPNADTLYSNAWLDLTRGPILINVPDTNERYYTLNFLDFYGNASNISARTVGTKGGRFLIATTDWRGTVPPNTTVFRVATSYVWILMRVLVADPADTLVANRLQDRFIITPPAGGASVKRNQAPAADLASVEGALRIIDWVVRNVGHPAGEEATLHQFVRLGINGAQTVDQVLADPETAAGVRQGFADAKLVIQRTSLSHNSEAKGWIVPGDLGRYGFNYLYRSASNVIGTGPNVAEENYIFVAPKDAEGRPLDGGSAKYRLVLTTPPPARFFWSVTAYDAETRELVPNEQNRYLVGDRTPGLIRNSDGSITIDLQAKKPDAGSMTNWLPVPNRRFYILLRIQGPQGDVLSGRWLPPGIQRR